MKRYTFNRDHDYITMQWDKRVPLQFTNIYLYKIYIIHIANFNGGEKMASHGIKFEYITSKEFPIYRGEFEISHKDCPLPPIADKMGKNIDIEVLFERRHDAVQCLRFFSDKALLKPTVRDILQSALQRTEMEIRVWVDGTTMFELEYVDPALNKICEVRQLPFGELSRYIATPQVEKFILRVPSTTEFSGKERLYKMEDELKEIGDAQLLSFRRVERKDLIFEKFREIATTPNLWIDQGDLRILDTAIRYGYFESPKRINLNELAARLGLDRSTLNQKLRSINRQVLDQFLRELQEPLLP